MHKLFTYRLVGKSKSAAASSASPRARRALVRLAFTRFALIALVLVPVTVRAEGEHGLSPDTANDLSLDFVNLPSTAQVLREPASLAPTKNDDEALWQRFEKTIQNKKRADYINGLSYVISGSIAIVGGYIGQGYSSDPLEKGVYTLFQTIGIASVGYGAYTWKIGSDDRFLYETISHVNGLDEKAKIAVIRSYFEQRKEREKQERFIKMLTHGLIAAFNLYNATQQTNESIKNGMFFIGGVNLLASVTYAF